MAPISPDDPVAQPGAGADTAASETLPDLLGTLVPPTGVRPGPAEDTIRRSPSAEPTDGSAMVALGGAGFPALSDTVSLVGPLGMGGMGVVRLGRQLSLDRDVAVKSVNPRAPPHAARRSLLQEAFAAATLEHPNVVPVHLLTVDAEGSPHVVMRRIAGRTWSQYIHDPPAVAADFGVRDPLIWHLGVLMQVCNALHYAHRRGVLHRDVKPDNVMIGRFGEVLLLDWGLAVRLGDDGPQGLPPAHSEDRVVGTPRYMAPEMARADGPSLSPRTDVYMLGGVLYAVLTGEGPHPGATIDQTLAAIPGFRPTLPDDVPPRLRDIVLRAMAPEPGARFEDAEALRLALQRYLEERHAEDLATQALVEVDALEALLAGPEPDRERVYRRFGGARFGFEAALSAWPDAAGARLGMRRALLLMARYELDLGMPQAAARRLAELADPPADLVARQQELSQAQAGAAAELATLRRDQDHSVGQRTRVFVLLIYTLIWTAIPLWYWWEGEAVSYDGMIQSHGAMLLVLVGLIVWARDSLSKTTLNRRVATALFFLQVAVVAGDLAGARAGIDPASMWALHNLTSMLATTLLIDILGPVVLAPGAGFLAATFLAIARPDLVLPANAATNFLVAMTAWLTWGRLVWPGSPLHRRLRRRELMP